VNELPLSYDHRFSPDKNFSKVDGGLVVLPLSGLMTAKSEKSLGKPSGNAVPLLAVSRALSANRNAGVARAWGSDAAQRLGALLTPLLCCDAPVTARRSTWLLPETQTATRSLKASQCTPPTLSSDYSGTRDA